MVVISFLSAAVVLACPLVYGLGGSSRSGGRERDRRLRYVARHPEQVNTGDICRLLSRELDRREVELTLDRAQALGVKPWTMLSWMQRFDVHTLSVVIAAELSHEELLLHLGNGTLPDLAALEVFAALNGLPASTAGPRATQAAPARSGARQLGSVTSSVAAEAGPVTSKMPPIFEPGSWPYDQFGTDLPAWPDAPSADTGRAAA
jgi:hypothetical protein